MQFGSLIAAEYRVNGNGPLSEDHTSCAGNELTSRWTALHSSSSDGKPREGFEGWTETERKRGGGGEREGLFQQIENRNEDRSGS